MGKAGRPAVERAGVRYGNVVVLQRKGTDRNGAALWSVLCDCGRQRVVTGRSLDSNPPSTHLGCLRAANKHHEHAAS